MQLVVPAGRPSRRWVSALPALRRAPTSHRSAGACLPVLLPGAAELRAGLLLSNPSTRPACPSPSAALPATCQAGQEKLQLLLNPQCHSYE